MRIHARWRCALCGKTIRHDQFKRHLQTAHKHRDQALVDREWLAFLADQPQLPMDLRAAAGRRALAPTPDPDRQHRGDDAHCSGT